MVADEMGNLSRYGNVIPGMPLILEYLKKNDLRALETGKHPISGNDIFVLIQEYETMPESEKKWESHKNFIDIQIVVSGEEAMGYSPIASLEVKDSYNPEKDVTFYRNSDSAQSVLITLADNFCAFFPQDAHKPGCSVRGGTKVRKAVVKARI